MKWWTKKRQLYRTKRLSLTRSSQQLPSIFQKFAIRFFFTDFFSSPPLEREEWKPGIPGRLSQVHL